MCEHGQTRQISDGVGWNGRSVITVVLVYWVHGVLF